MSNAQPDNTQDPDYQPPTAKNRRQEELLAKYRRRFKEYPPSHGVPDSEWPAFMRQVEKALETGRPIRQNIPPGVEN